jgi:hypothetical protein
MWQHILNNPTSLQVCASPYMYLVGMTEAAAAGPTEVDAFNQFYNTIHVPEVLTGYGFESGARYERLREFMHPEPGSPRYLAMYGIKDEAEIAGRVPALLGRLAERYAPRLIVIACNTASTIALPAVRHALDIPIVGTVPAIKPAAAHSQ